MLGPVFNREAIVVPKRAKTYLMRAVYVLALFLLLCTGYLVLDGSRSLATTSDSARFGGWMFTLLAPLQLLVLSSLAAVGAASSVAQEKDRRTLLLLLLTRLTGFEVVGGKLAATLLAPMSMLLCGLPLFLTLPLLGGVSPQQVLGVFIVTAATVFLAGTVGTVVGMWREKTFQSIAMTVLLLLGLVGLGEVAANTLPLSETALAAISPPRALMMAASPIASLNGVTAMGVVWFVVGTVALGVIVLLVGVVRVRVWNPSREVRMKAPDAENSEDLETSEEPQSWKVRAPRHVMGQPNLVARSLHLGVRSQSGGDSCGVYIVVFGDRVGDLFSNPKWCGNGIRRPNRACVTIGHDPGRCHWRDQSSVGQRIGGQCGDR